MSSAPPPDRWQSQPSTPEDEAYEPEPDDDDTGPLQVSAPSPDLVPIELVVASSADAMGALTIPTAPAVVADANTVVIVVIFKMLHS